MTHFLSEARVVPSQFFLLKVTRPIQALRNFYKNRLMRVRYLYTFHISVIFTLSEPSLRSDH